MPDSRPESNVRAATRIQSIQALLDLESYGVLATMSRQYPGFPFGSLCPFALEPSGNLLILVSGLAEHAKNLKADPKASFYVQQSRKIEDLRSRENQDPQDAPRVCLLVQAHAVEPSEMESVARTYLARFPSATTQLTLGDFYFVRLVPEHLRMIEGFGSMFWMHADEYRAIHVDDPSRQG